MTVLGLSKFHFPVLLRKYYLMQLLPLSLRVHVNQLLYAILLPLRNMVCLDVFDWAVFKEREREEKSVIVYLPLSLLIVRLSKINKYCAFKHTIHH